MKTRKILFPLLSLLLLTAALCLFAGCGMGPNDVEPEEPEDPCLLYGHSYVEYDKRDATCTEEGFIRYVCSVCGAEKDEFIAPFGEHQGEWVLTEDPGCGGVALRTRQCTVCGEYESEFVVIEHKEVDDASVLPDCTETGLTAGKHCTVCGRATVPQVILPANGHVMKDGVCETCGRAPSEGLVFRLQESKNHDPLENEYWVTGIGTCTDTDIVIPETYNGTRVTRVCYGAFNENEDIRSVTIPAGCMIEVAAFRNCTGLTFINIPGAPVPPGKGAFEGCTNLTCMVLRTASETSDGKAFFLGNLFGASAYTGNHAAVPASLKTVVIAGHTDIAENAFYGCDSLENIFVTGTVGRVGEDAFRDCDALKGVYIDDLVMWAQISFSNEGATPLSTARLYLDFQPVTSVILPEGITSIGDYAFFGAGDITEISLPSTIRTIGGDAFYDTGYYMDDSRWENGALYIGKYLIDVRNSVSGRFTVKAGTVCIAKEAFWGVTGMTGITLPAGIYTIDDHTFHGCTGLRDITLPAGIAYIGNYAFMECTALESIRIPEGTEYIGECAFYGCLALASVEFSTSVKVIYSKAFYRCSALKNVVLPEGSADNIHDEAFAFSGLTSISIPSNISLLGMRVFMGCGDLENITVASGCSLLKVVNNCLIRKNGMLVVGFSDCSIPADGSVRGIEDYAFQSSRMTEIVIPEGVESIGESAFEWSELEKVTMAGTVKKIGYHAFANCSKLREFVWLGTRTTWLAVNHGNQWDVGSSFTVTFSE